MRTVHHILESKGRNVWSVSPSVTVFNAISLMDEKNVGAIPVLDGDKLAGIFSERDYARKVVLKGKSSRDLTVGDVMTSPVISISPKNSIQDCMKLMTAKHIRHLPVLTDGKLVGIISIGDVVMDIIDDQKSTIDHLSGYITGKS